MLTFYMISLRCIRILPSTFIHNTKMFCKNKTLRQTMLSKLKISHSAPWTQLLGQTHMMTF